jgi:2-polyprenyl-3-methyl-5-hydroxy-6-metoxy-1,4-benzoquinol methylase
MSTIENSRFFPENSHLRGKIDHPRPHERVFDQSIFISGRIDFEDAESSGWRVQAWFNDTLIGETALLSSDPESHSDKESSGTRVAGFRLLARFPQGIDSERDVKIRVTATRIPGQRRRVIGELSVRAVPSGLDRKHYGDVLQPTQKLLLHPENIYGSGPPVEEANPEVVRLVLEYLPRQSRVLDVGCGAGAYGPPLIAAGHTWLGLELSPACCAILDRRALPYRQSKPDEEVFPVENQEFDWAICIEVLEHIANPNSFVSEIARAIRQRAIFSVPNLEVIPLFASLQVVPWHLLEADHKNFFTRTSLHALLLQHFRTVEVFSYAAHPVHTREGITVHAHLFAIASK